MLEDNREKFINRLRRTAGFFGSASTSRGVFRKTIFGRSQTGFRVRTRESKMRVDLQLRLL